MRMQASEEESDLGRRLGRPGRRLELRAVGEEARERTGAGAKAVMHLHQRAQPLGQLLLVGLRLRGAPAAQQPSRTSKVGCGAAIAACLHRTTGRCAAQKGSRPMSGRQLAEARMRVQEGQCSSTHLEALVGQDDGAVVMQVPDDAPACLVHRAAGLRAVSMMSTREAPYRLLHSGGTHWPHVS